MKKALLSFTFLTLFFFVSAQTPLDSLRFQLENIEILDSVRFQAINNYYVNQALSQPDSVIGITEYHYNLAKEKNSKLEMAKALNEKAFAYYLKGDTKIAMIELDRTIQLYKQLDDTMHLATIYGNMGNIYGEERQFQEAVNSFNKSLELFQFLGNEKGEARMFHNLGLIYYYLDNENLALEYFNNSLLLMNKLGLQELSYRTFVNIGDVFFKLGNYLAAIEYAEKGLQPSIEHNNKIICSNIYYLLAQTYQRLNQKDTAKYYIDMSLEIDREINNPSPIIKSLTLQADLIFDYDLSLATFRAEEALKLINSDINHRLKVDLYKLLYKCYKKNNEYSLALTMHENFSIFYDSLQLEKNNLGIIENAIQKEFDEQLLQNKFDSERVQSLLKYEYLKKTVSLSCISVLFISLILLYTRRSYLSNRIQQDALLAELELLKRNDHSSMVIPLNKFELNRNNIEKSINRKLNNTDWNVLTILLADPVISNKNIATKAFMSLDGISSSLRRMYEYFNLSESKYKKIALLLDAVKRSSKTL